MWVTICQHCRILFAGIEDEDGSPVCPVCETVCCDSKTFFIDMYKLDVTGKSFGE